MVGSFVMIDRPTDVEVKLSGKPAKRAKAEAWATDPGITVGELQRRLRRIGIRASRSGTHRFRRRLRYGAQSLRVRLMVAMATANAETLAAVEQLLSVVE
jgi:hypothetical protein